MAQDSSSPTGFDLVVERVQNKFPHFLLGITFLLISVVAISLIMRNNQPQQPEVTSIQPVNATAVPASPTPTPQTQKSIGSRIAEFFIPKDNEPEKQPEPTPTTYIVREGDGLWNIAETQYKDGNKWMMIAEANSIQAPYVLEVGQKLVVPSSGTTTSVTQTSATPTITQMAMGETTQSAAMTDTKVTISGTSYTVEEGDCLWTIAQNAYGDGFLYTKIAEANSLSNPNLIYPGTRFVLPRN